MLKFCCATLFVVFATIGSVQGSAGELDALVRPDVAVAGLSQGEWSREWWQWAAAFHHEDSPVADPTGEKCHLNQSGPVWFLAGTYETRRTVRKCTVPRDKYLFFPLINYVVFPGREVPRPDCLSVTRTAKQVTDAVATLVLELRGVSASGLVAHRQATTECFNLAAKAVPRANVFPSAANGYYAMLKPLSPGTYVLNFGGILPGMMQAVTYTLVVR